MVGRDIDPEHFGLSIRYARGLLRPERAWHPASPPRPRTKLRHRHLRSGLVHCATWLGSWSRRGCRSSWCAGPLPSPRGPMSWTGSPPRYSTCKPSLNGAAHRNHGPYPGVEAAKVGVPGGRHLRTSAANGFPRPAELLHHEHRCPCGRRPDFSGVAARRATPIVDWRAGAGKNSAHPRREVAVQAGLSVPDIANLEKARGNPTLDPLGAWPMLWAPT